eukprot:scaffold2045_cov404-Prasinococcus_capsulatus_cf.AAC.71
MDSGVVTVQAKQLRMSIREPLRKRYMMQQPKLLQSCQNCSGIWSILYSQPKRAFTLRHQPVNGCSSSKAILLSFPRPAFIYLVRVSTDASFHGGLGHGSFYTAHQMPLLLVPGRGSRRPKAFALLVHQVVPLRLSGVQNQLSELQRQGRLRFGALQQLEQGLLAPPNHLLERICSADESSAAEDLRDGANPREGCESIHERAR